MGPAGSRLASACEVNCSPFIKVDGDRKIKERILKKKLFKSQYLKNSRSKWIPAETLVLADLHWLISRSFVFSFVMLILWGVTYHFVKFFGTFSDPIVVVREAHGSQKWRVAILPKGISSVDTLHDHRSGPEGEHVEVVFGCSATGKPAPTIEWDISPGASHLDQTETTTASNSDHTFTSSHNVTLQVPADWSGHVDCLLNRGQTGEKQKRIPFSLSAGRPKAKDGMCVCQSLHFYSIIGNVAVMTCRM